MRKSLSLLAVIASLVSLTACSSATSQSQALASPGECADTSAGAASKAISVTGGFGSIPEVSFAKDSLSAQTTERTIVTTGDGEQVQPGDTTFVEMSIFNAVTGSIVAQTAYGASPATAIVVNDQKYLKGLVRAVECTTVGSRVAAFVTPSDGFGSAGSSDGTVQADQPLVVVADVLSTVHSDAKADGVDQEPVAGMPAVELDAAGRPTVTIPETAAPSDLQVAVLKQGDGAVVQPDAEVIINYQGVNWRTGEVFDESWGNGPTNFQLSAVVKGFSSAIAGQHIGSQVIAVIPPDLGYGPSGGNEQAGIEADDTIVFVIDILDASSTTAPAAG